MASAPIQIKVKALERLLKEDKLYSSEAKEQQETLEKMRSQPNVDEYDLRKQQEIVDESQKMLLEMSSLIARHRQTLTEFLDTYQAEDEYSTRARELL